MSESFIVIGTREGRQTGPSAGATRRCQVLRRHKNAARAIFAPRKLGIPSSSSTQVFGPGSNVQRGKIGGITGS